jgi:hypothetical protein
MKLNEKQLTFIFCAIFFLGGWYLLVQFSGTALSPIPPETKHAAQVVPPPTPLSVEDEAMIKRISSEKLVPLSKEDKSRAQTLVSSEQVKPLSAQEEAFIKKMQGI